MPSPTAPRISVILSFRNPGQWLEAAVASVPWQTEADWELIAIDDGSTDGSADLPLSHGDPRIRLFRHPRSAGLPARLNEGVRAARGRYIARMDADDIAFPQRFRIQSSYLDAHPGIDLLASSVLMIDEAGDPIAVTVSPPAHEQLIRRASLRFPMPHPTWMGRAEWFRAHPYDEQAIRAEDQHLLYRTHRQSRFAAIEEPLLAYRCGRLSARNSLQGRASFLRGVRAHGTFADACTGTTQHAAAALRDLLMIALRRDRAVVHRRGGPIPGALRAQWETLRARLEPDRDR